MDNVDGFDDFDDFPTPPLEAGFSPRDDYLPVRPVSDVQNFIKFSKEIGPLVKAAYEGRNLNSELNSYNLLAFSGSVEATGHDADFDIMLHQLPCCREDPKTDDETAGFMMRPSCNRELLSFSGQPLASSSDSTARNSSVGVYTPSHNSDITMADNLGPAASNVQYDSVSEILAAASADDPITWSKAASGMVASRRDNFKTIYVSFTAAGALGVRNIENASPVANASGLADLTTVHPDNDPVDTMLPDETQHVNTDFSDDESSSSSCVTLPEKRSKVAVAIQRSLENDMVHDALVYDVAPREYRNHSPTEAARQIEHFDLTGMDMKEIGQILLGLNPVQIGALAEKTAMTSINPEVTYRRILTAASLALRDGGYVPDLEPAKLSQFFDFEAFEDFKPEQLGFDTGIPNHPVSAEKDIVAHSSDIVIKLESDDRDDVSGGLSPRTLSGTYEKGSPAMPQLKSENAIVGQDTAYGSGNDFLQEGGSVSTDRSVNMKLGKDVSVNPRDLQLNPGDQLYLGEFPYQTLDLRQKPVHHSPFMDFVLQGGTSRSAGAARREYFDLLKENAARAAARDVASAELDKNYKKAEEWLNMSITERSAILTQERQAEEQEAASTMRTHADQVLREAMAKMTATEKNAAETGVTLSQLQKIADEETEKQIQGMLERDKQIRANALMDAKNENRAMVAVRRRENSQAHADNTTINKQSANFQNPAANTTINKQLVKLQTLGTPTPQSKMPRMTAAAKKSGKAQKQTQVIGSAKNKTQGNEIGKDYTLITRAGGKMPRKTLPSSKTGQAQEHEEVVGMNDGNAGVAEASKLTEAKPAQVAKKHENNGKLYQHFSETANPKHADMAMEPKKVVIRHPKFATLSTAEVFKISKNFLILDRRFFTPGHLHNETPLTLILAHHPEMKVFRPKKPNNLAAAAEAQSNTGTVAPGTINHVAQEAANVVGQDNTGTVPPGTANVVGQGTTSTDAQDIVGVVTQEAANVVRHETAGIVGQGSELFDAEDNTGHVLSPEDQKMYDLFGKHSRKVTAAGCHFTLVRPDLAILLAKVISERDKTPTTADDSDSPSGPSVTVRRGRYVEGKGIIFLVSWMTPMQLTLIEFLGWLEKGGVYTAGQVNEQFPWLTNFGVRYGPDPAPVEIKRSAPSENVEKQEGGARKLAKLNNGARKDRSDKA